jgi:hypothetical protein
MPNKPPNTGQVRHALAKVMLRLARPTLHAPVLMSLRETLLKFHSCWFYVILTEVGYSVRAYVAGSPAAAAGCLPSSGGRRKSIKPC